jgi:hypothetical protein
MKQYILNILIGLDQFVNAILGGLPDHTISGRVGYAAMRGNKIAILLEKLINLLFWFDKDHCRRSIEWDEVKRR